MSSLCSESINTRGQEININSPPSFYSLPKCKETVFIAEMQNKPVLSFIYAAMKNSIAEPSKQCF